MPGQIDGSLEFDDSNERHVNVPHDASLQLATDMTVSAWVKTTDADADVGVVVSKWGGGGLYAQSKQQLAEAQAETAEKH